MRPGISHAATFIIADTAANPGAEPIGEAGFTTKLAPTLRRTVVAVPLSGRPYITQSERDNPKSVSTGRPHNKHASSLQLTLTLKLQPSPAVEWRG